MTSNSEATANPDRHTGCLSVARPAGSGQQGLFETFITITADGAVTAYNGHVDLGTGIRTALGQIVAEELDVPFKSVKVIRADTALTVNQGGASGSTGIQAGAITLT